MRRFALVEASMSLMEASTVCSVQKRKMQMAMATTVDRVRIQFRRRCLRTKGRNFISSTPRASWLIPPQHALVEVVLDVGAGGRARVVGDHHDRLVELAVERLHEGEDVLRALGVEVAR